MSYVAIELPKKREEILEQLEAAQAEARKVLDVIENPDVVAALRQDKVQNLQFLKDNYDVSGRNMLLSFTSRRVYKKTRKTTRS